MSGPVHYHVGGFPPKDLRWEVLIPHLGPAAAAIARYDGILGAIPNAAVLLSSLTMQEAVLSSRIEGTQATMGEVLEFEAGEEPQDGSQAHREDIQEIINYRRAMERAGQLLGERPLSLRVIQELHVLLLEGARGRGKAPGQLRRIPNWIGAPGAGIDSARFVPVAASDLQQGLSRWERYIHEEAPDRLVQVAIIHAEFEALHPFLDGNGRLGRILIPLLLWQYGLIRAPMFYLSAYLERHRATYYDRLLAVSRDGDWTGWCRFFLEGVRVQAEENFRKGQAILALHDEYKPLVVEWTRSQFATQALEWLFHRPIFRSTDFIDSTGIPPPTARRLLREFQARDLIRQLAPARGQRAAVHSFPRLLAIAEAGA